MNPIQSGNHFNIERCRSCKSKRLTDILDLGNQPLANSFLKNPDDKEHRFPLNLVFCESCLLLQIGSTVDRELLFQNYVYHSSTSEVFRNHFQGLASIIKNRLKAQSVIDIGSNDGILLRPLVELGIKATGIEPSKNLADFCNAEKLPTFCGWIDDAELVKKVGFQADVVTACNVFAHVDKIRSFVNNAFLLLNQEGTFIIEVQHLLKLVEHSYFDMIYHEHFYYYSLKAIMNMVEKCNLRVVDVEEIPTHGGSIRVYIKRYRHDIEINRERIDEVLEREGDAGLYSSSELRSLQQTIQVAKNKMRSFLDQIKAENKVIMGYGAPAKGNTLLNYYEVDSTMLERIIDDSASKQGLYTPGTHIRVTALKSGDRWPDYFLILAWNFADSIITNLRAKGYEGKFIIPLPEPTII